MRSRSLLGCAALMLCSAAALAQSDGKKDVAPAERVLAHAQAAGRFRVTLTGFSVERQTRDNIFESDGKGDEVYFVIDSAQYDGYSDAARADASRLVEALDGGEILRGKGGNLTQRRSLLSVVMGDVNDQARPQRIQAGSAGPAGGLRTGDRFPTNEPWLLAGAPLADRLPMLLWEGELRRGRDLVVIVPTVWEWDGGNPPLRSTYSQDINFYLADPTLKITWGGPVGTDVFGAGDRPVGMVRSESRWAPAALFLNFDTAHLAATTSPGGMGTGVVNIGYWDLGEHYSLYIKVERMP